MDADVWTTAQNCETHSCVEVQWRKSSLSREAECVEVAIVRHTADEKENAIDER